MKKKFLAVLLALCMTLALLPGAALAAAGGGEDTNDEVTAPAVDGTDADSPTDEEDGTDAPPATDGEDEDTVPPTDGGDEDTVPPVTDGGDEDTVPPADDEDGEDAPPAEETKEDSYYISIPSLSNGDVIPSAHYAASGERVTLNVKPASGYELDTLTVADIRGRSVTLRETASGTFTFTMPASRVTVDAKFVKTADNSTATTSATPSDGESFSGLGTPGVSGIVLNPAAMPFTDVNSNDWFYANVEYVWQHYLMSGVSDTQFAPNTTTSRAMIWTILARMNNVRTDINPGSTWYEKGMLWAVEEGVTDGSDPLGEITREQLATMLWRNAGSPAGNGDLSSFSDSASVSSYALTAVRWAVANGILNGSGGLIDPQGTATRAQVAAMAARYGDKIA